MSSSGYVISVDPAELANRFASPDALLDEEPLPEEEIDLASFFSENDYEEKIAPLLDEIPPREADMIHLYYVLKKRQADIAEIFSVTQAAVSYNLARGIQRLKFLIDLPIVSAQEMRRDLADLFEQTVDIDILVGMWETTCQSKVAANLRLTQGRVRHRFFKAVAKLKKSSETSEKHKPYEKIFSAISAKRFNIKRRVILPQWEDRGIDKCL